ncbi:M1 family metallopeptidase [Nocardioides cynanchi]|uniref:M1 family metallopeptidase n=1 Tax=Nocardioides cynanchi TaxID=2558918 RepID=UPI0017841C7E|nr:M1 family metallopeptidase [Nocardioides cynanchi]
MRRAVAAGAALVVVLSAALTGCGSSSSDTAPPTPAPTGTAVDPGTESSAALSTPRRDSVYPDVGGSGVDALSYDLGLSWDAKHVTLTGNEALTFRASATASSFRLDLAAQLEVSHVWLDGHTVAFSHPGKDLVVGAPVTSGDRHLLQLTYSGVPEPVVAPTDRPDFDTTGWTTTSDGSAWTMQEPYGAYSWYAVDDQPADKAFYDFTISSPGSMVGIANGELLSRRAVDGRTVTRWRLPEPASSYLVTIAIGHYRSTTDTGPHGLPITYWTPTGRPDLVKGLSYTPQAIAYLEGKLGRYPFPTLGVLLVPSNSAMETQSTVTLGIGDYTLSRDVLVHELAHQWYGDEVTPADWSDLWMSEGMATYLAEVNWTADHGRQSRRAILTHFKTFVGPMREQYGPPARYRPGSFGEGNVYYIPALMWDTIRQRLGDAEFWKLVAAWPRSHRLTSQSRDTLAAWWSRQSGQHLTPVFHRWLLSTVEPPYTFR